MAWLARTPARAGQSEAKNSPSPASASGLMLLPAHRTARRAQAVSSPGAGAGGRRRRQVVWARIGCAGGAAWLSPSSRWTPRGSGCTASAAGPGRGNVGGPAGGVHRARSSASRSALSEDEQTVFGRRFGKIEDLGGGGRLVRSPTAGGWHHDGADEPVMMLIRGNEGCTATGYAGFRQGVDAVRRRAPATGTYQWANEGCRRRP